MWRRGTAWAAVLLAASGAATVARGGESNVRANRTVLDAVIMVGFDDLDRRTAGVAVTLIRYTSTGTRVTAGGVEAGTGDYLLACLEHSTRSTRDFGCTWLPGRAVTSGQALPEAATVRIRVPSERRKGGWIEADLVFTASGTPQAAPGTQRGTSTTTFLGLGLPNGGAAGAGTALVRYATVTGTVRTDRGPAVRPRPVLASLVRGDTLMAGGRVSPGDVSRAWADLTAAAAPRR